MKKIFKLPMAVTLVLALVLPTVLAIPAKAVGSPHLYDPFSDGIVSSYYHIDRENGFITGIAPGTTAEQLRKVLLPGDATISHETLVTGSTVTITVTEPVPPETTEPATESTEPPTETTAPPTEDTVPPSETTEVTTEATEPPAETTTETTVAPSEVTETTTETTAAPSESTETTTETTAAPSESTETTTETTAAPSETTETTTETTAVPSETTGAATETTAAPSETSEESTEASSDTGAAAMLRTAPETRIYTLTVIVTGDLNGDGNVTITDMLMLKSAVLGESLSNTASAAADLNFDGKITITDFLKAKSYLLGLETITGGWPTGTTPEDPLLLMTPSTSDSWTVENAASYCSGDEAIAIIDNAGIITSMATEGSTFVYALDTAGNIIDRIMVTVLNEKLTISLGESSRSLIMGQALTLSASFNHFIAAPIFWTSSDPDVVSVNQNGELTTNSLGTAVITATLRNGSKAECTIQVIPPLTDLSFGRPLYKLKPGHSRTLNAILTPADTGEELLWSSSDTSIATVNSDGIVTGVSYGTVTITVKGKYSGLTASCSVKICDVKQVAITFDDGPSIHTAELLNYLRDAHIPATFFMVGNRLQSYSNTLSQMVADGHEIGYHSYSHTLQSYLSSERIKSDFKASSDILRELTGAEFTVWRAPGGDISDRILGCIPLPHIGWSVDTYDWQTQDSDSNYRYITGAKDGAIILLHDLYQPSVSGAIRAMKDMNAGDYEFVTVTELLSRGGTPPQNSVNYYNG